MAKSPQSVGPLKKINLALSISSSEALIDIIKIPQPMEFIFGLGADGLTHFEYLLAGKQVGDELIFPVKKIDGHHQFAHLYRFLPRFPVDADPVFLKITVEDVSEPTQREIVKAMAESAACGADCGCGCGSH
jgi:hypothetical protein